MVFKLVRVDGSEPCKIPLPVGTHIVGRGKFLDCNDMRVSRNHGMLEVTEDSVILKSLHTNPCFYIKKSLNETKIIKQDETVTLFNGDKFGLVPESHWYEVLLCHIDVFPLNNPAVGKEKSNETNEEQTENVEDNTQPIPKESCLAEALDKDFNGTVESPERPESPSLLPEKQELTKATEESSKTEERPSTTSMVDQLSTSEAENNPADELTQPLSPSQFETRTPVKRTCSSPEGSPSDEIKKIKKEPDSPEDVKPGPSNDRVNLPKNDGPDKAATPANPPVPLRERCMYGANCYRKNVQHKAQFSHPADPDWGPGARGDCPWGRACRRRDARHWRDHAHPPAVRQPDHRPGKRTKQNKVSKKDSDEDSAGSSSGLIVTGKRVRKTINRPGYCGSDSDSNDDPFQTDESDEWEPPSDVTGSQNYSQYSQD